MTFHRIFAAVLIAVSLIGCAGRRGPAGEPMRVGFIPSVPQAVPLVLASRDPKVLERRMGARLEYKPFRTEGEIIEALRAGGLDLGFVGPTALIASFWERGDLVALAGSTVGGSVLVARPEAMIREMTDLAGRTVATPEKGDTQDVLLRYQMALHGLRPKDQGGQVEIIHLSPEELAGRFTSGRLDAACVPEPWASRLERGAGAVVILGSSDIFDEGNYPAAVLVARREYVEGHQQEARSFVEEARGVTETLATSRDSLTPTLAREIRRHTHEDANSNDIQRALLRIRFNPNLTQHTIHVFANLVEVAGYKTDPVATLDGVIWRPEAEPSTLP